MLPFVHPLNAAMARKIRILAFILVLLSWFSANFVCFEANGFLMRVIIFRICSNPFFCLFIYFSVRSKHVWIMLGAFIFINFDILKSDL